MAGLEGRRGGRSVGIGRRVLLGPLWLIAVTLLLVEEALFRRVGSLVGTVSWLPGVAPLEAWIRRRQPWQAAVLFLVPFAIVQPLKIVPVILAFYGHPRSAALFFAGIELTGALLLGRLFLLCGPQLMSFRWFARAYYAIDRARAWLHGFAHWHIREPVPERAETARES